MLCLTQPTDPRWVDVALSDLSGVLVDHAHCEMKAASNALSLAGRSPSFPRVVRALCELAEEEIRHFKRVLEEIERRGLTLGKPPVDTYASELRRCASATARERGSEASLVDRLLVGAIIEARSCERFQLLYGELARRGETELSAFYEELFEAEARHFRTLVDLAVDATGDPHKVKARLSELASLEGALVARLDNRATVHG